MGLVYRSVSVHVRVWLPAEGIKFWKKDCDDAKVGVERTFFKNAEMPSYFFACW